MPCLESGARRMILARIFAGLVYPDPGPGRYPAEGRARPWPFAGRPGSARWPPPVRRRRFAVRLPAGPARLPAPPGRPAAAAARPGHSGHRCARRHLPRHWRRRCAISARKISNSFSALARASCACRCCWAACSRARSAFCSAVLALSGVLGVGRLLLCCAACCSALAASAAC